MKKTFFLLFQLLLYTLLHAQLSLAWSWDVQSSMNENSVFLKQPVTGNLISGNANYNSTENNIYSVNTSSVLQQLYVDSVSGCQVNLKDGLTDSSGSLFFLTTYKISNGPNSTRIFSLNTAFQPVWQLVFPFESPIKIDFDPAQNIIVLSDSDKIILRKISSSGAVLWTTTNDSAPGNNHIKTIGMKLDKAGNIYVVSKKNNGSDFQYSLKKFWPNGNFAWEVYYNPTPNDDTPYDMFVDDSCNIYVTGESLITSNGSLRGYATEKVDSAGTIIWTNNYTTHSDVGRKIFADHSGNAYVAGTVIELGGARFLRIIKYSSGGDTLWTFSADTANIITQNGNSSFAFSVDSNGVAYLAYYRKFTSFVSPDMYIEKLSTNGQLIGQYIISYCGLHPAHIIVNSSNNIYISGINVPISPNPVYPNHSFILNFDDFTGISESVISQGLFSLYPNPSDGNFQFSGNFPAKSQLHVYNMAGQEVMQPMELQKGNNSVQISIDLANGIYFCTIILDGEILDTEKLMIVR